MSEYIEGKPIWIRNTPNTWICLLDGGRMGSIHREGVGPDRRYELLGEWVQKFLSLDDAMLLLEKMLYASTARSAAANGRET